MRRLLNQFRDDPHGTAVAAVLGLLLLLLCCSCSRQSVATGPTIDDGELWALLREDPDWSAQGIVVDKSYVLVDAAWVKANISAFSSGDCDDWAGEAWRQAAAKGAAFGMVTTSNLTERHVYNFFVDAQRKIWLYEPQNGKAWRPSKEELWLLQNYWV